MGMGKLANNLETLQPGARIAEGAASRDRSAENELVYSSSPRCLGWFAQKSGTLLLFSLSWCKLLCDSFETADVLCESKQAARESRRPGYFL